MTAFLFNLVFKNYLKEIMKLTGFHVNHCICGIYFW